LARFRAWCLVLRVGTMALRRLRSQDAIVPGEPSRHGGVSVRALTPTGPRP